MLVFGVDFDGTCVTPNFPELGADIGAAPVLKALQKKGHKVFLWTLRGSYPKHYDGTELPVPTIEGVYQWEKRNNFKFDGYNKSPLEQEWTDSKKEFAHYYIDDMSIGCPLTRFGNKKAVDWRMIVKELTYQHCVFTTLEMTNILYLVNSEVSLNQENYAKVCIQV